MPTRKKLPPPPPSPASTNGGIRILCKYDQLMTSAELQANPQNYRRHPVSQLERIKSAIIANGWRRAVVVSRQSGMIVTGHGAANAAGLMDDNIPVEFQDFATPVEETRHMVADNKASDGGENDDAVLSALMKELAEMEPLAPESLAMDARELELLLKSAEDLANPKEKTPPKASTGNSSPVYELVFDDKEQQATFHAWLRRLKSELPDIRTIAARVIFAITRP